MDPTHMLHDMCSNVLTNVDIKAIRKHRGFSEQETATNALLENFFLTEIGIEQAMSQLTSEEVITLHMLKTQREAVGIAFFRRLYGSRPKKNQIRYSSGTFTQRYQSVLKSVQTSLVRRGLLLMAEEITGVGDATKMERWRFRLPHQFERFLPPFLPNKLQYDGPGSFNQSILHEAMKQVEKRDGTPLRALDLKDGTLYIQGLKFSATYFQKWLQDQWKTALSIPVDTKPYQRIDEPPYISPTDALLYILNQLAPNEWISTQELESILYLFSGDRVPYGKEHPTIITLCNIGWKWGQLVRYVTDGSYYYRLAHQASQMPSETDPADYLTVRDQNWVRFDLATIPLDSLEQIARTSDIVEADRMMAAQPSLIKLGQLSATARNHPVIEWLQQNLPSYATALKKVEKDWGKQIIHKNLLVAKINDLSLKVAIERAFSKANMPDIQQLPNDYIAFPRSALSKVEQAVKKAGHVVKTVKA